MRPGSWLLISLNSPGAAVDQEPIIVCAQWRALGALLAAWRDMPERFGPWSTVYQRFRDWHNQGRFDVMLKRLHIKLNEQGLIDLETWMIDSAAVHATRGSSGAGSKGGLMNHQTTP